MSIYQAIEPSALWGAQILHRVNRVREECLNRGSVPQREASDDGLKTAEHERKRKRENAENPNSVEREGRGGGGKEGGKIARKKKLGEEEIKNVGGTGIGDAIERKGIEEQPFGDEEREQEPVEERTVLVHNLLFNYEQPSRELLDPCGKIESLRFKWLEVVHRYSAKVRFTKAGAAKSAAELSGTMCMGRRAVIEIQKDTSGDALSPERMKFKTDYVPPADGPLMETTACTRGADELGHQRINKPRHPVRDCAEDNQWKLSEHFDLKKLPRAEVERLLPGWTYSIDNRPSNGSWYLGSGQGYGKFTDRVHEKDVEYALISQLLYPGTMKFIFRGSPSRLLGHSEGAAMPVALREAGGVAHDQGVLPIHPEASGASRPIYVGYGDSYCELGVCVCIHLCGLWRPLQWAANSLQ